MFGVGRCNGSCFGIFLNMELNNCFWKIQVVLKRTFKCFIAVVLKGPIVVKCSGSTIAAVWCQLTAEEAEAGLAADVPAAQWCLEDRQHVGAGRMVKTAGVCRTFGCSTLTADSQRR